jgi:WD40 repeat protein
MSNSLRTRLRVRWLFVFLIAGIAVPFAAAAQEVEDADKTIRDADGQPIPHALVRLGTTAWRHSGSCLSLDWSADSKTITVNRGTDGLRTLDAATGRQIRRLDLPAAMHYAIGMSPDGKELVYRTVGSGVRTIDAVTAAEIAFYPDLRGWWIFQYSPSGKYFVSAMQDHYDVVVRETGEILVSSESLNELQGFAFSSDETRLYVAAGGVSEWDLAKKKMVQEYSDGEMHGTRGPALSPDGKLIAVGQVGVDVFEHGKGKVRFHLEDKGERHLFLSVAFSPDGKRLIAASQKGPIYIWNVADWKLLTKLVGGRGSTPMKLSPDGKRLAVAGSGTRIWIWDLEHGKLLHDEPGHAWEVRSVAFSPDSALIATGSVGKETQLWEAATGKHVASLPAASPTLLTFASKGQRLLTFAGYQREIAAWKWGPAAVDRKLACAETTELDGYVRVFLSPDHRRMLQLTEVFKKELWSMEVVEFPSMKPLAKAKVDGLSRSGAITGDGTLVAFGSGGLLAKDHHDIQLFDVAAAKTIGTLQGHTSAPEDMAFTPDGKLLVSGGCDRTLRVWNVAERKQVHALTGQGRTIAAVAISPNGRVAATCGTNICSADARTERIRHVVLWDLKEGIQLDSYSGHDVDGQALAFSPDGKRLASGLNDGTTIVWETPELAWK